MIFDTSTIFIVVGDENFIPLFHKSFSWPCEFQSREKWFPRVKNKRNMKGTIAPRLHDNGTSFRTRMRISTQYS